MTPSDFDLKALYRAIDAQRRMRVMTWAETTAEINRGTTGPYAIAASTIRGLTSRSIVEGDGVLQMLLWLGRPPESFVPDFPDVESEQYRLRTPPPEQILRWDAAAIHSALDVERSRKGMTWKAAAAEIGGVTPGMLATLAKGGRTSLPSVMRIVRWLDQPAARFTVIHRRLPS